MAARNFSALIDGALIATVGAGIERNNPATEELVGRVPSLAGEDAKRALCSAAKAFPGWANTSPPNRATWMLKLADALVERREEVLDILMAETGKPLANAEYDFGMLTDCLHYYADEIQNLVGEDVADKEGIRKHTLTWEPRGVAVGFLAWNFPLLNVGYKLGPALAAGCPIILKPSSVTPLATALVGEVAQSIGLPKGVLQIITGDSAILGPALCKSEIPATITMIGSTRAGCEVIRNSATSVKQLSLELGGNAPVLVYPDADIDNAVAQITGLKYENCGQICVSPNRVFVHEDVYESFVAAAVQAAQAVTLGWGREPDARMGPMMTSSGRDRFFEWTRQAVEQGAKLLTGGGIPEGEQFHKGNWVEPTVLGDVVPGNIVYAREVFGPMLSCIRWRRGEDEIALANDTEYGLAAYVFASDAATIERAVHGIQAGSICVNEVYYDLSLPHGGTKQSGVGRDCSPRALEEYMVLKRVTRRI